MQASAEFMLALECCRCNFVGIGEVDAPIVIAGVDWDRFVQLVRFHRIEGLAWNSLASNDSEVPSNARNALSNAASGVAAQSLRMGLECRALLHQFESAAVPLLFLKGSTVGALAYRNPALKSAVDIDLLIDPADLGKAAGLLRTRGYELVTPPNQEAISWHRHSKESVWGSQSLQIDLHTRTADNPRLISDINVHSPRQLVDIGGGSVLPTFAPDELFAYLAVHGASSAWFRLKWISDFAALLHAKDTNEIDRLYRRSQELGAGKAAGQALLIANALFGTLENTRLRVELEGDRATRRLCETALRLVANKPAEPTDTLGGTLPIHWTQFLLMPGLSYKFSELSGQLRRFFMSRMA